MPPRISVSLHTRASPAPRSRDRSRRWDILPDARSAREAPSPHLGRSAHRAAEGCRASRPPRNPRRPIRPVFHRHHQSASDREVACCLGRPHRCRRDLRPRRPQRPHHQPLRPFRPQAQRPQTASLNPPRHSHGRFAPGLAQVRRSACPSVRTACPGAPEYALWRRYRRGRNRSAW